MCDDYAQSPVADAALRFAVLGPFEVWRDRQSVAVSSPKHRALLAALVLQPGRTVPTGELARAVWGVEQPANPRRAVQVLVTRLRGLLPGTICTGPDGYALGIRSEQVDLGRFQYWLQEADRAADRADLDKEAGALVDALAQWRGEPLADVASDVLQHEAAPRLAEHRLRVVARRIDVDLRRGRHAELVAELSGLVAEHPLRERFWAQLMAALSATGRRADALAAYHKVRQRLAEELGIDPGEELQRQYASVLEGRSRNGPPGGPPVPRQLPAEVPGFAGRSSESARLDGILAGAGGDAAVIVIAGMAGVGKTALTTRWARRIADHFPDGQLWANLRGFDPGQAVPPGQVLARFLRALGVPGSGIPLEPDEQSALYRSLMDGRRMLVVLDNARNAEQVRPLLPGGPGSLVVVTSRDQLTSLVVTEAAHSLRLDVLDPVDARQLLLARLRPQESVISPAAVDHLIDGCGRLPLALAIVAARAATHPGAGVEALAAELRGAGGGLASFATGDPRADVRTVLSWSYRALSPAAARLFRLLAVHPGPDFTAPAAAGIAGGPVRRVCAALSELARANLVTEHTTGRYTFHDLVRAYARERAQADPAERRAALRRLLDHYLYTAHAAACQLDPHRDPIGLAAPPPGVPLVPLADHEQAMEWFAAEHQVLVAAVTAAARERHHTHAWQLAWLLVHFLDRRGFWHELELSSRAGLVAAEHLDDPLARACAHRGLGQAYSQTGRLDDARTHYQRALAQHRQRGDRTRQARVHVSLGWLAGIQDRHREALSHSQQALELFRQVEHRAGEGDMLNAAGWCYAHLGEHERALEYCQRALAVVRATGSREGEANTLDSLGYVHVLMGNHPEAVECYRRSLALMRELGERHLEGVILEHLGDAYQALDDRAATRTAWREALDIFTELDHAAAGPVRAKLAGLNAGGAAPAPPPP